MPGDTTGYWMLVLHAHLPFVRHPEHEYFLEENWLYEAITECYLPLIRVMEGWERDGIPWCLTISISPPLATMLADELLCARYERHLDLMEDLAEKEIARTAFLSDEEQRTAHHYQGRLQACREVWERYEGRLNRAFAKFRDTGKLELLTSSATHGFLPLLRTEPESVRAQVLLGADEHERIFGKRAPGCWNAECGYYPGLEEVLDEAQLRFFFADSHAILRAERRPSWGVFAPLACPNGVHAFGRDQESSSAVWSADEGYPGDPDYRDFYRDIGFDLPETYIGPYIHPDGIRLHTGFKYHRVTGATDKKALYDPEVAARRAREHAADFLQNRRLQMEHLATLMPRPPLVVSPYDAELFGHWWYEGPQFIDFIFRHLADGDHPIEPITPTRYLELYPHNEVARPSISSWGNQGYAQVWLDKANEWIYPHLHEAARRMTDLVQLFGEEADPLMQRALRQAGRELLLAQSSDWAFIMSTGTAVEYAEKRTRTHIGRFLQLDRLIRSGDIDATWLAEIESRDNIFPYLNSRIWL